MPKKRYLILLTTFSKRKDAENVAEGLIQKRLAGCCNLIPGITSFFRWEGKRERSREVLLLIKTESHHLKKVEIFFKTHHPYTLPELVGVPIVAGEASYLAWLGKQMR